MSPSLVTSAKRWISLSLLTLVRIQICRRCWKSKECAGAGGFFLMNNHYKQKQQQQQQQKKKTVVDHSGNDHTILKSSNLSCILSCGLGH